MAAVGEVSPGRMCNMHTGVHRDYRGRKLAQALKLLAIEFCRKQGMPVTKLDYYLRRDVHHSQQKLIPVRVIQEAAQTKPGSGFTLVLTNGLRLEMAADFDGPALARFIGMIKTSTEISTGRG